MTTPNATPWLAIATDSFLSGWGGAAGRSSIVVYECRDEHEAKLACEYLEGRPEMKRVRTVYECRKAYAPRNAHVSRYDAALIRAVAWYREDQTLMAAARAEDAKRRAAIDARPPHTCRYCGLDVSIASRALAQENPTKARLEHSIECEWIATHLPMVTQ